MNAGLVYKSMREWLPLTIGCGLFLMLMEATLASVLPAFQKDLMDQVAQIEFLRNIIQSILGTPMTDQFGPESFSAFPWAHPVILITLLAHAIVGISRMPAGEVDRGTIDLVMGWPVSRWQVFLSETMVWIANALIVLAGMLLGNWLGGLATPAEYRVSSSHVVRIVANLLSVYLAIGGIAWLVSALSSRRGTAILIVFAIVLASILFNFLMPFWELAQRLSFLGLLSYYRPLEIIRNGEWPVVDMIILLAFAGIGWTVGGVVFSRRDLAAN